MIIEIALAWPDSRLSPNSREHWRSKAEAFKLAKETAYLETVTQAKAKTAGRGPVRLSIYFYPPDKRKRDVDNLLSSIKAYLDGVSAALDVNDYQFNPVIIVRGQKTIGGAVKLSLASGGKV